MSTMKTSAVLAAAFVSLFVGSAGAEETVVAKVPFPFVVRGETFPAGRYEIRNDNGLLAIRGMDNGSGVFALAVQAEGLDPAGNQPALVFIRHENKYHLSQIWESSELGRELPGLPGPQRVGRSEAHPEASDPPIIVLAANSK
jgi:hypothetical protein